MTDVDIVRDWVGSEPDDATVLATLTRVGGDPLRAALSILRRRYADLTAGPLRWAVVDDYSEDSSDTVKLLRDRIGRLEALTGDHTDPGGLRSTPIAGPDLNER